MTLTNNQLVLIDTLMYCKDITNVNLNITLKEIVENLFYDGKYGVNEFNSKNDRLGYEDNLKQLLFHNYS